jgi:hypothetical protein
LGENCVIVDLELFGTATTVQPIATMPGATIGGETNSVDLTRANVVDRYLNATVQVRKTLLPEIPKTEDTVKHVIAACVFSRNKADADSGIELLSSMGWETYAFALKYTSFARYLRPMYNNYVWELLARGVGYADDIEMNVRRDFLTQMSLSPARPLAYVANDVLANIEEG